MMFTRLYIGENDELGKSSFRDILVTLSESELVPRTLVFWNNAVKACVEGSPLLPTINKIERLGVRVLVAGHALDKLNQEFNARRQAGEPFRPSRSDKSGTKGCYLLISARFAKKTVFFVDSGAR